MRDVFVTANNGTRLMPASRYRARKLLDAGKKTARRELGQLPKTHANDAYTMGAFHPKHRHYEEHYQKHRRNNRVLSKFYDAKYIDIRDGSKKSGSQLGCNRTNRRISRNNPQNERVFRGRKVSKGRVSVRKKRYGIRPGDLIKFCGKRVSVTGIQNLGSYVKLADGKVVAVSKIAALKHTGGWQFIPTL